ncbi:MAG: single-stranded-DNA-specific exonuclease RecJ [Chloroflexota bacterium]
MTLWIEPVISQNSDPLPDLHPLVRQALLNRGFFDPVSARAFLDPHSFIESPSNDLPGLSEAAGNIIDNINKKEPICVWGDFDVDGQTSTTVLVQTLQALDANVSYHIPIRKSESHGVNIENLARIIAQGAKLIITCDTGITANESAAYARSRGVAMVITDHHDLPAELPTAIAVVNPKMLPETHPLATLAGVGVAYKLAQELISRHNPHNFQAEDLLDLVAMGLVADLAILRGDTRCLVQKGLELLRNTKRLGLQTMMELAEFSSMRLTEEHIGFGLGPRLNAIGRLGDANPMVELLTTKDPIRSRVMAAQLEGLNVERKLQCDQVYQAAEAQLQANPDLLAQPIIILAHPQWPGGIVGIVASKIVERYRKPAILLTAQVGEPIRGSARSIEGLNITAAIAAQKDLLLGFGGHPMAAGLSMEPEKLPEFRRKLAKTVQEMLGPNIQKEGQVKIDGWLKLNDANIELAEILESLAPYGPGNSKLTLASRNLTLVSATKLGKNKEHMKLTVSDENGTVRQILWWDGGNEEPPSGRFDLAYSLRASDWRGSPQAQMEYLDIRVIEREQIQVKAKKLEILDYRNMENPLNILLTTQQKADTICWAEGEGKKKVNGQDRNELSPAKNLVIWSTPPSRYDLLSIMEKVKPEQVIVFAIDPGADEPKYLLERLAGLVKYTLNKKNGITNLSALAAATAQKESNVRLGLECLAKRGLVKLKFLPGEILELSLGDNNDTEGSEFLENEFSKALDESRAFRKHFRERTEIILG